MPQFLLLDNLGYRKEDSAFLDISEFFIDCSPEHSHCRRETHVGIHQGRNIEATVTDEVVEDSVVFLIVISA